MSLSSVGAVRAPELWETPAASTLQGTASVPQRFPGFAESQFAHVPESRSIDIGESFVEVRKILRRECPMLPGVYGMLDENEKLIYVGLSCKLQDRLLTYFQGASAEDDGQDDSIRRTRKERRIAKQARRLIWDSVGHELLAELRELELIRHHKPKHNVKDRATTRPSVYVILTRDEAPRFRVVPDRRGPARARWGPFPRSGQLREQIEELNMIYGLRDCSRDVPIHFADQQTLFAEERPHGCLRGEIRTCLAPCSGGCTRKEYQRQVTDARRFLEGNDTSRSESLLAEMQAAAIELRFERAERLKQQVRILDALSKQTAFSREARHAEHGIYRLTPANRRETWLVIVGGVVVRSVFAPSAPTAFDELLQQAALEWERVRLDFAPRDWEASRLLAHWFRRYPEERTRFVPHHQTDQLRPQSG